jgi:ribosome-associated toxin RatA of RatAB toxin-antitoxin module
MKILIAIILSMTSLSSFALRTKLSPADLEKLKKGKELEKVEELKNEVFPRVTLINIIPHTPKENMKVFSDFNNHKKFIPGLKKSKIVKVNGNSTDVAFEMEMPIVDNTEYTTRNTVVYEGNDAILTWDLVKSKDVKKTKGMVMFEELDGKTLFTYVSHITPDSSMAWAVKSRVLPDVKKNIEAVKEYLSKNAGADQGSTNH